MSTAERRRSERRQLEGAWPLGIRIVKLPSEPQLEGFDLRPFEFKTGGFYHVHYRLCEVLLACRYAEPDRRVASRRRQAR